MFIDCCTFNSNVITLVCTQISHVERGGATVFPELGLRIPPNKVILKSLRYPCTF